MKRFRGKLTYANVISTLALILAVGGGTAYAASSGGSSPGTLKLCAAKKTGDLRLASGGGCRPGERALSVATNGIAGPAGATGERGPAGDRGQQGDRGAQGDRGIQGERGPAGPATIVESPDGKFTVSATNAGIAFTGPKGSLKFDGEELRTSGNLTIFTELGMRVTNGTNLVVTTGAATSITTGASFNQTVGGAYEQDVGGSYEQTTQGSFKQLVGTTYSAQSAGAAVLQGSKLTLGGSGTCPAAGRVGSEVAAAKVAAPGSSNLVFVC
jgi:collagen triple helix repeat protein